MTSGGPLQLQPFCDCVFFTCSICYYVINTCLCFQSLQMFLNAGYGSSTYLCLLLSSAVFFHLKPVSGCYESVVDLRVLFRVFHPLLMTVKS